MKITLTKVTAVLLGIIILLLGITLVGGGYYLGKIQSLATMLTPTQFPQATPTPVPTAALMTPTPTIPEENGMLNPASAFCTKQGATVRIQTRSDGTQYGLCTFDGGYACEEWSMFRGDCPIGGVRTTGFDTIEQKYCAWNGGSTLATPDASCTFTNGTTCNNNDLYNGICQKSQ